MRLVGFVLVVFGVLAIVAALGNFGLGRMGHAAIGAPVGIVFLVLGIYLRKK